MAFIVIIIKKFMAVLMSLICTLTSVFGLLSTKGYVPKDAENVKLTFATISDIHLTKSKFRSLVLSLGLKDMEDAENKLDLLCMLGDNTDFGKKEEYENLLETFKSYRPAENIIMAIGNHDTRTEDNLELAKLYYNYYSEQITGRHIEGFYYSTQVKGYTFIVMGSEYDGTNAWITDTQIEWLDSELSKACGQGKPVFVISHWPINGSHGLPYSFEHDKDAEYYKGGLGLQSDRIKDVMKKYTDNNDIFYLNGHLHSGIITEKTSKLYGWSSFDEVEGIHSINNPSFMYMSISGEMTNGTGFVFEVYDDEVIVKGRNFVEGVWYSRVEETYKLKKSAPV